MRTIIIITKELVVSEDVVEIRETLSEASQTRLDRGEDGVLHILVGQLHHLDQAVCAELATTLATGLMRLIEIQGPSRKFELKLVPTEAHAGREI